MFKGQTHLALITYLKNMLKVGLPKARSKGFKIGLGLLFLTFFSGYQPTLGFPPIKESVAKAQVEQISSISAESLPFKFQLPHPGYLSTHFSNYHPGVDIATGLGMPIKPIAEGTVVESGFSFWGLGLNVVIEHPNGYRSTYAHMGKIYVKKDQKITSSSTLGTVGLTGRTSGPHTHLEVTKDGNYIDPIIVLPEIRTKSVAEDFTPIAENKTEEKIDVKKKLQTSL